MSKPNQPKDIKPRAEGGKETKSEDASKKPSSLLLNIITTTLICGTFLAANFIITSNTIKSTMQAGEGEETVEPDQETEAVTRGIIVDLGEFTVNLSDISPKTYLKADVSLEVTPTEADTAALAVKETKGGGGHGGHGAEAPPADPKEAIDKEMAQFKPALRDAVITVLSSKTSDELSTTTGKELAKEQISEQTNTIFGGEREILRVSFGQFIMQQGR